MPSIITWITAIWPKLKKKPNSEGNTNNTLHKKWRERRRSWSSEKHNLARLHLINRTKTCRWGAIHQNHLTTKNSININNKVLRKFHLQNKSNPPTKNMPIINKRFQSTLWQKREDNGSKIFWFFMAAPFRFKTLLVTWKYSIKLKLYLR